MLRGFMDQRGTCTDLVHEILSKSVEIEFMDSRDCGPNRETHLVKLRLKLLQQWIPYALPVTPMIGRQECTRDKNGTPLHRSGAASHVWSKTTTFDSRRVEHDVENNLPVKTPPPPSSGCANRF
ncbi:unnamed protein product [Aphanomyces euteiches]